MRLNRVQSYKDLLVWRRAMELVHEVYVVTRQFPSTEIFGLCAQLRRSAVSIPSNVAEGNGRHARRDYIRLLLIARGSSQEVETQLLIAERLQYLNSDDAQRLTALNAEVGRMLSGLVRSLSRLASRP